MNSTIYDFNETIKIEKRIKEAYSKAVENLSGIVNLTPNMKLVIEYAVSVGYGVGFDDGIDLGVKL